MSDPVLLQSAQTAPGESLWEKAPAWRNLVTVASLLTVLAVATPALLPVDVPTAATPHRVAQTIRPKAEAPRVASAPAPVAPVVTPVPQPVPAPVHAPPRLASLQPAPQVAPQATPQTAPQPNVCLLTMPAAPTGFGQGTVLSFEDHATSLARIKMTEARAGGQIDPDYVDNQRVTLRMGNGSYQIFLVPRTMHVNLGDRVMIQGGYRNINLPCNYIPNLITADLGPPPQAAPMAGNTGNPP